MKELKSNVKILKVEKLKNSYLGNPAYNLTVELPNGETLSGRTATNAMIGYEISWTWEGEKKYLAYHFTKNEKCIFDRVTKE